MTTIYKICEKAQWAQAERDGALFPHLYGALPLTAVRWVKPVRLDDDGRHMLPPLEA